MKDREQRSLGRRAFLGVVGQGLIAASVPLSRSLTLAGGATLWPCSAQASEELVQPEEIRSRNGILDATLTAAPGPVRLGSVTFQGTLYNGSYLPPLMRARTGDILRITFRNQLSEEPSNLHFHGMAVSPKGNSDNVFIHVHPGEEFKYEVQIPAHGRQGPGLFWYHPHAHGVVTPQMLGGMSGGLVIDGLDNHFPILRGLRERFFFIKHAEQQGREIISINGQVNPTVSIKPGEIQFWRLAHIGATLFIKFRIEGMPLYAIATDGHPLSRPRKMTTVFIGPGERIDALVIGPPAGEHAMTTIPFQNQAWRAPDPAQQMATILASGGEGTLKADEAEIMEQRVSGPR